MDKINPIAANFKSIAQLTGAAPAMQQTGQDFAKLLQTAFAEANQGQLQANQVAKGLVTGEVENIHRAVMSIAQADLNFRYVLQVRNKIVDAYQEIMRMQI